MAKARQKTVVAAITQELEVLAKIDPVAANSSLGATALALATRIDDSETPSSAVASCARALVPVIELLRLRGMPETGKPDVQDRGDAIDELGARRRERLGVEAK